MTVLELGAELNTIEVSGVSLKFAHYAWSKAPAGDYGVYGEDSGVELYGDSGVIESGVEGTIDYFTRNDTAAIKNAIEGKLKDLKIPWHLNSIQYEDDTGFIHYEWVFGLYG